MVFTLILGFLALMLSFQIPPDYFDSSSMDWSVRWGLRGMAVMLTFWSLMKR